MSSAGAPPVFDGVEVRSYYGRPVLAEPVWTREIPWYFFTGGLAGASAGLAFAADVTGNDALSRRAWPVALAAVSVSPPLLISDLGRPKRFLNMLRVFKVTSPMSVGTWILSAAGTAIALASAHRLLGLFPRAGKVAGGAAAALGMPLTTYTATLISDTAVPVWHEARRELPFVFAAGAAASAGGAATALTPPADARPARALAIGAVLVEVATSALMHRRLGELAEPYRSKGPAARYSKLARGLSLAGAAALSLGGGSRRAAVAGGAMTLAGAVCERWSIFKAGIASATDPRYTIGPQRRRLEDRARDGQVYG